MKKISVDTFNKRYESKADMSRAYKIKPNVFYRRVNLGWSQDEALGISGRGLDAKIKNGEKVNKYIEFIEFAYIGLDGKTYYECLDISILEDMLLNTDEILMYRQPDLKTAIQEMLEHNSQVVKK